MEPSVATHSSAFQPNGQQKNYESSTQRDQNRKISPTISKEEEQEACLAAMAIATGSSYPIVLKSVIELGVLDIIGKAGPNAYLSSAEIASHLPTKNPNAATTLERLLRLLASYTLLSHSQRTLPDGSIERLHGLTPVSKVLSRNEDGGSLAPLLLLSYDNLYFNGGNYLTDAVLEGNEIPFNKAYGMPLFECCGKDPKLNKIMNDAMSTFSTLAINTILENYDGFEALSSLVDVGGGIGTSLHMILSKYPTIKGINFDLPHVIHNAPSYQGIEHVRGNMFTSVPKANDAILIKFVCHNWRDEECVKLFKNCYEVLPDHGKVIVCDYNLSSEIEYDNAAKTAVNVDIMMLLATSGKERTDKEFETLAKNAGFAQFKVACSVQYIKIMEFFKK